MYTDFYRLSSTPFRLTPDPKFFFASSGHSRGLAYLRYGLQQGQGFVVITGVPGTGKSMLIQALLAELSTQKVTVATIANTNLEADDVLRAVADAFGVRVTGSSKADYITTLERFFREQARHDKHVLLVVDEAQNLPRKSLEELRMLSNFQEGNRLLVQTVLIGQQQLQSILADPSLEQLSQRVIAACHLKPISAEETRGYIEHRLRAAAWRGQPSFDSAALVLVYRATGGNPRLINILADRLLLAAYLAERHDIDAALVEGVLAEFNEEAGGVWNGRALLDEAGIPELKPLPAADEKFDTPAAVEAASELPVEPLVAPPSEQLDTQAAAEAFVDAQSDQPNEMPSSSTGVVPPVVATSPETDAQTYTQYIPDDEPEAKKPSRWGQLGERKIVEERVDADGFYLDDEPEVMPPPPPPARKRLGGAAWSSIATTVVLCAMGTYLIVSEDLTSRMASWMGGGSTSSPASQQAANITSSQTESAGVKPSIEAKAEQSSSLVAPVMQTKQVPESEPALELDQETELAPAKTSLQKPPAPIVAEFNQAPAPKVVEAKPLPKAVTPPAVEAAKPVAKPAPKPESRLDAPQPQAKEQKTQLAKAEPKATPKPVEKPVAVVSKAVPKASTDKTNVDASTEKKATTTAANHVDLAAANNLAHGFALAYEEGDLQYFPKMFRSDAEADGTRGIVNIMRDYQELFQATMMRNMVLSDFDWTLNENIAHGVGMFEVSVWEDVQSQPSVVRGVIEFEMTRSPDNQRLLIRNLSHRPQ